jgi:hypothetical protein
MPALPKSSALEGLRMVYVVEGNLYFQEGSNPPEMKSVFPIA